MTNSTTTPLVLSFSGLLRSLIEETLSPSQLWGAIYYLGTPREATMDGQTWTQEVPFIHLAAGAHAYTAFRADVPHAERANRIVWTPTAYTPNTWEGLNRLLANNGLPVIEPPSGHRWIQTDRYCYPAVTAIVQEQELPYRVIW